MLMRDERWSRDALGEDQIGSERRSQSNGVDTIPGHQATRKADVTGAGSSRDFDAPLDGAGSAGNASPLARYVVLDVASFGPFTHDSSAHFEETTASVRRQAVV